MKPIRLKKILDHAKGQDCTVNSPVCNYHADTVVACHYGEPGERGMGLKPDDTSVFYGCSACHALIDQRRLSKTEEVWYVFRAMRRTWAIIVRDGVLK